MIKVIDISKHQGNINFKKTAQKGVKAVMMRVAYGQSIDSRFDEYYKSAVENNISVGCYMFATWHYSSVSKNYDEARKNAVSQTKKALSFLSEKNITAPVAVDIELEKNASTNLSEKQLTDLVNVACDLIKNSGYKPLVYTSVSWLKERFVADEINSPIWVAYYCNNPQMEEFPNNTYGFVMRSLKNKIVLWQFSSKGDGKSYGADSTYIDENFCYDEKMFFNSMEIPQNVSAATPKSLYTVKIRQGSWYIRSLPDVTSKPLKIISGNITLDATQKRNSWFYIKEHKGWIGPAAIDSFVYNQNKVSKTHTVKKGETLSAISKKYNISVNDIVAKNISKYKKITRDYIQTGWILNL